MRRLVMWNVQTLDGYFEGKAPWDLQFHEAAWGDELKQFALEQIKEVGTLLYGRATYEGMFSHWTKTTGPIADFMHEVPKVVFSRTLDAATWKNTRLVRRDAADEVAELKRGDGKDLFVFGSAKLSDSLMRRGLFDELRICVAPVVLGTGVPLFKPGSPRQNLTLLQARSLDTGALILRYAAKPQHTSTAT
jgi:dihydrofolate reductase